MAVAGSLIAGGVPALAGLAATPAQAVIVQASSASAAAAAVAGVDGTVDGGLELVGGVAAHVDPAGAALLAATPGVTVVADDALHASGATYADGAPVQLAALDPGSSWGPDAGHGVGVALIDTGVSDNAALAHVVRGPDFSGDNDGVDRYGHGTFVAGLIAGAGTGVAPGATIVSVKVAGTDGTTTLSRVIQGIGWAVTHRDDYRIQVLNLSFGVDGPMPYQANPLAAAVEAAWASNITVVVAAGNQGDDVEQPADDPYVISVGASDTHGTATAADDTRPAWSSQQQLRGYAKPELVAPGVSTVSLRVPGSTIDRDNPQARVGDDRFKGTGTSMSAALTSGAAAVLAGRHPGATPDDVKGALVATAHSVPGSIGSAVDLAAADAATAQSTWWQHHKVAFGGLGLGLRDGMPWTAGSWTAGSWTAGSWTAGSWTAGSWTAGSWTAGSWTAGSWTAGSWTAGSWTAGSWTAGSWTAGSWTAGSWTAGSWTAGSWG